MNDFSKNSALEMSVTIYQWTRCNNLEDSVKSETWENTITLNKLKYAYAFHWIKFINHENLSWIPTRYLYLEFINIPLQLWVDTMLLNSQSYSRRKVELYLCFPTYLNGVNTDNWQ